MKTKLKLNHGFTIIEVMIVLAIAGLILAIVFIAVPQLQRNTRDNSRQNILTRIKAEMETYASNNQGIYPFRTAAPNDWTDFHTRYLAPLGATLNDPSTGLMVIPNNPNNSATAGTSSLYGCGSATCTAVANLPNTGGVVHVVYAARCDGEALAQSGTNNTNTKKFAIMIGLDRASTRFCVDNG